MKNMRLFRYTATKAKVLLGALLLAAPLACADPAESNAKPDLTQLVVVGDSLSAGFQNFSLFDNTTAANVAPGGQRFGFASLIARQAGADLTLPLFAYPGLPPALKLTPLGIVPESGVGLRYNLNVQATNLSVPGFTVADMLAHPFPGNPANAIDGLSALILGFPESGNGCGPIPTGPTTLIVSEVACAQALKPTTILVSAGNNDALQSITMGLPPTTPAAFAAAYAQLLGGLTSTGATVVVANIPDVTSVPFLIPAAAFYGQCGFWPVGAAPGDFVVPNLASAGMNICVNYVVRPAAFIQSASDAVKAFNAIIDADAKQMGATVVDLNGLFTNLSQKGYVVGGRRLTTGFLGGLFSLDGIHPTNTGYAILANEWIKTMNRELHTGIPPVSVEQVAKTDPLVVSTQGTASSMSSGSN